MTHRRLLAASLAYAVGLGLAWGAALRAPDAAWLAFLVKATPPGAYVLPLLALLAASLAARARGALVVGLLALGAVLFGVMGLQVPALRAAPPADLRLVTWNVEGLRDSFEESAQGLAALRPDIVVLQEAPEPDRAAILARRLGLRATSSRAGDLAVLARGDPLEVCKAPLGRGNAALVVRLEGLTLVNVHLTFTNTATFLAHPLGAPGYLEARARRRSEEVDALLACLRELPRPLVLAGDLNVPPTSDVHRRLRGDLRDCFDRSGAGFGWTFPARAPLLRIDYVYVSEGLHPVRTRVADLPGSDHLPVVADLGRGGPARARRGVP